MRKDRLANLEFRQGKNVDSMNVDVKKNCVIILRCKYDVFGTGKLGGSFMTPLVLVS